MGTMEVEILVHAKRDRHIKRRTLQNWLDIEGILELEELEIEPIRPEKGTPFIKFHVRQHRPNVQRRDRAGW